MDIVEDLTNELKGIYKKDDLKKGHTPSGTYISQNSYGIIKKDNYSIKIYCFDNMGVRAVNSFDGSPFKIVLALPFSLKRRIRIFPKSFFKKLISNTVPTNGISAKGKLLLKKYNLKDDKQLSNYIFNDTILPELISNHIIYINTNVQDKISVLTLRPNESILTVKDLNLLYNIMDRIGSIISDNRNILEK